LFDSYNFVTVVDSFPTGELELPTISVEDLPLTSKPNELGNRVGKVDRMWAIDIFAKNKAQRDEFAYLIKDALEMGIPVYNYDEGFPPSESPTQIGALSTLGAIRVSNVYVFPELQEKLYWRKSIVFSTEYAQATT
jgi:hypothetical protein